ncbi:Nuclease-related domain-containing protein [Thermomonospora echinospora]|uniref:Nuclease-related domain-containing protein n=1 Tax=Thermomonospora echinospora TaxID=1992 RepID=A0A1H6D4X8_9ACTN|nr:nuclease-related domain-containing protein [Thermomonospora echinospora]SEG80360.1 Nuclease-related domain-containing protein [Thermomonospora echinospora]
MIGSSIYTRGREAFTGGSPQAVFEELWLQDRKSRLRTRAIIAVVALLVGGYVVSPLFGLVLAVVAGGLDALVHYRRYQAAGVWRRGLRGEERMSRLLRWTLERRGYRVLHQRVVPGHDTLDQLLIGPGGVWLIDNQAWHPETELTRHGDRLFIDDRTPSQLVKRLTGMARTVSGLLTKRLGTEITVAPLLAVHGGRIRGRGGFTADGITVLSPWALLRWPARHPTAELSPEQIEDVLRAAVYTLPIGGRTMTDA